MHTSHHPVQGLRVAITGGTSGLGLALVEQLHREGAQIAFIARSAHAVRALAQRLPGTHGIVGDVADKGGIHPLALQVTALLGGLDLLVHCAGTLGPAALVPLADTECEDFETALATNLLGPFRLSKALLGALAASARVGRPAVVVNISSDAAMSAYANWGAYSASKAAVAQMSRVWDEELRGLGIRMLAHDPGDMATPMYAQALPEADLSKLARPETAAAALLTRLVPLLARHETPLGAAPEASTQVVPEVIA